MMIVHNTGEQKAFMVGRKSGLKCANTLVEQLTEQLIEARAELQQARAERAAMIAQAMDHVQKESAACQKELAMALEELNQLRLMMFQKWTRTEADTVN